MERAESHRDATTSAEGVEEHLTKLDRLLHKIPPWVYFNIRNRREIYYAILLYGTIALGLAALFIWGLPWFVDTLFTPFVDYARENVATWLLVLLIFACFIIFPVFFITPSPAIWLAAWLFPLWEAIAIVFAGTCVKFLLPFFIGRKLLPHRIQRWAKASPRFGAAVMVVESEGAFKTVTLLRLSITDNVVNYFCAAMDPEIMPFLKYFFYSIPPSIPFVVLNVLGARQLENLTDLLRGSGGMTDADIAETVISSTAGLFLAIWALWYGRRKYRQVLEDIRKRNGERVEAADPQDCTIAAAVEEPGAVRALEESSVSAWTSAVKEGQAYGGGGGEHGEGKLGAVEDDMAELESSALGDARGAAPRD